MRPARPHRRGRTAVRPLANRRVIRVTRILVVIALVGILYSVLFVPSSADEPLFYPEWAIDDYQHGQSAAAAATTGTQGSGGAGDTSGENGIENYWYNGTFGAVSPRGEVVFAQAAPFYVNYSPQRYAIIERVNTDTAVRDSGSGRRLYSIPVPGYPHIHQQRAVMVFSSGYEVAEWSLDRELWRRSFAAPIAGVGVSARLAAIGLLDGRCVIVDRDGKEIGTTQAPGGVAVVAAVALSGDGARLAVIEAGEVDGTPRAWTAHYEISETGVTELYRFPLAPLSTTLPPLRFIEDTYDVMLYHDGALYLVDDSHQQLRALERDVKLVAWDGNPQGIGAITAVGNRRTLTLYYPTGTPVLALPLGDQSTHPANFLHLHSGLSMTLGSHEHLIRLRGTVK